MQQHVIAGMGRGELKLGPSRILTLSQGLFENGEEST
jgi:hypothetical protein